MLAENARVRWKLDTLHAVATSSSEIGSREWVSTYQSAFCTGSTAHAPIVFSEFTRSRLALLDHSCCLQRYCASASSMMETLHHSPVRRRQLSGEPRTKEYSTERFLNYEMKARARVRGHWTTARIMFLVQGGLRIMAATVNGTKENLAAVDEEEDSRLPERDEVVITINCDNSAINGEDCGRELARILQIVTDRVDLESKSDLVRGNHGDPKSLFDINGNRVGSMELAED